MHPVHAIFDLSTGAHAEAASGGDAAKMSSSGTVPGRVGLGLFLLFLGSVVAVGMALLIVDFVQCGAVLGPLPEDASPEGGVCGNSDSMWKALPYATWLIGSLMPPGLALLVYRRQGRPAAIGAGLGALIVVPILVVVGISATPDTCSAEQRRELPRSQCFVEPAEP